MSLCGTRQVVEKLPYDKYSSLTTSPFSRLSVFSSSMNLFVSVKVGLFHPYNLTTNVFNSVNLP